MTVTAIELYDLVAATVSALGLLYLLDDVLTNHEYRWPLVVVTFSVFGLVAACAFATFVDTGLGVTLLILPEVGILLGLDGIVYEGNERGDWAALVASDPTEVRRTEEWMTPLDDHILSLFHSTHLVLTPAIIAYNLDYSRSEVSRRLSGLVDAGYVKRVEKGKYRLTSAGEAYLDQRTARVSFTDRLPTAGD